MSDDVIEEDFSLTEDQYEPIRMALFDSAPGQGATMARRRIAECLRTYGYHVTELVATPDLDTLGTGEEQETTADCRHCGGPLFKDFIEVDDDRWRITDDTCFWQHNDERYTPGRPSPCGPSKRWEELRV